MPDMGMSIAPRSVAPAGPRPASLADALFGGTQQRVLGLLFGQPDRSFYASELIGLAQSGSGAVQREPARLASSGLVTVRVSGKQKHYQANRRSPVFAELAGIVLKTVGLAEPIRAALEPFAPMLRAAFVFGSVAKGDDTSASDIDVMLVGDGIAYADVFAAVDPLTERLGRKVNPTVYGTEEFERRMKRGDSFVTRVLEQPRIWLVGSEDVLRA